jgi:hypothetical protein
MIVFYRTLADSGVLMILGVVPARKGDSMYDSGGAPSKKLVSCHFAPAPRSTQRMCRWRCRTLKSPRHGPSCTAAYSRGKSENCSASSYGKGTRANPRELRRRFQWRRYDTRSFARYYSHAHAWGSPRRSPQRPLISIFFGSRPRSRSHPMSDDRSPQPRPRAILSGYSSTDE